MALLKDRFNILVADIDAPLKKIGAVNEQVQVLCGTFTPFRAGIESRAEPTAPGEFTPAHVELSMLEDALSEQISEAMERIACFELTKEGQEVMEARENRIRRGSISA